MPADKVEFIKCIVKQGKRSWCGSDEVPFFQDLEHAELTVANNGRLIPCPDCIKAMEKEGISHLIPDEVIACAVKELANA